MGILSIFIIAAGLLYSFPLITRYQNSIFHTLENSFEIATRNAGWTILILLLAVFETAVFSWNSTMVFLGILFGPMIVVYTVCGISKHIFKKIEIDQGLR